MTAPARLRQLLSQPDIVVAPGVYDGITARLSEQAGYAAAYMTGAGTSMARGYPDFGLLTMGEMAENAGMIARSIAVPLIADADTGYGNELNVTRTVREYEMRGVAAIHIEDQVSPKRCGHLDGKEIVAQDEFVSKIRAAATSLEELAEIPKRVNGPCLLNIVPGGKTPQVTLRAAQDMGYRLAILPGLLVTAVIAAADAALAALKDGDPEKAVPGADLIAAFKRFGTDEWNALRRG
jgi:2-methylisocitrate lyase-like PEP mutase family enzyme